MKMVQVKLRYKNAELVTWLENDKRLKPGVKRSLRQETSFYEVVEVYTTVVDFININTTWLVGGLK
jgi:hypothetical protein